MSTTTEKKNSMSTTTEKKNSMSTTTEKKDLGKIQSMFKFLKSHKFKIGAMIFVVIVVSLLIAYATGAFDATDTTDTPDTTTDTTTTTPDTTTTTTPDTTTTPTPDTTTPDTTDTTDTPDTTDTTDTTTDTTTTTPDTTTTTPDTTTTTPTDTPDTTTDTTTPTDTPDTTTTPVTTIDIAPEGGDNNIITIPTATGAVSGIDNGATTPTDTPDTTTTPVTTIDIAPEGGDNNIIIIPTATGAVSGIDNGAITIEPTYNGPWPVDVTEVVLIHSIGKIVWQKSITSNVDGEFTFDLVDIRYQPGSDTLGNYGSGEVQLTKSLDEMDTLLSASKLYGSVEAYTNIQRRYKLESEACIISGNLVIGDNINGSSINVVTSCDSSDLYKWTMEEYEDLSIYIHVVDTVVRSVDGSLSSKTVDKNSNLKLDDLIVIRYPQSIDPTAVKLTVTTTNDPDGEFNNILMGDVNHNVIQNGGFVRYKCKYIDGDENIFETTVILEINTPVSQ